jgi:hypothetical protein
MIDYCQEKFGSIEWMIVDILIRISILRENIAPNQKVKLTHSQSARISDYIKRIPLGYRK